MKRKTLKDQTKTSILQRYDAPSNSYLTFENPLHILLADFNPTEISVITGLSLKTIQRQRRHYNIRGYSHATLAQAAHGYLSNLPQTDVISLLIKRVEQWL